ncbi:DoxX family protein [Pseudomonas oryzihabitans]|uniref:DoxX family protein n=1 Tax=Pseudomonas oryzihabitans TaxID=47885 RepID=UPI00135D1FEF|nr:DoxX family protein [Pseudomonas oryzihabitans]MXS21191.1 DoxX family membrane protein [Pseudomonas oryzihabitans]
MGSVRLDLGLLFLRLGGAGLLLAVHGLPKALHFRQQLGLIEDPLHLGAWPTLGFAVFAEVLCPLLIALGWATRLACLPILGLLLIALLVVHPEWSLEQGQFGWLLLVLFGTLALTGPGRYSLETRLVRRHAAQGGFARALS